MVSTEGGRKRYRNDTSNATLLFIDESFWINKTKNKHLDVSRPVQCGTNKCFFETTDDPDVGYLIAPQNFRFKNRNTANDVFQTLEASFKFVKQLQRHNVKHFLLTPPINLTISKRLANHLNSRTYGVKLEMNESKKHASRKERLHLHKR